ncbi:polyprenyl synthetase family protein [Alteribacter populi]|uniref:polyprenyl synthetase family protein n=1 Tax=Alteribacter populi TaxID=2011011 RepID=UPI000BBB0C13|nr:farnesyl diphosphate synthase [Alteribacter populi]
MNETALDLFLTEQITEIERRLPLHLNSIKAPRVLKDAMNYSLQAGGKRLRPALLLATLKGYGVSLERGYDTACAVEMIHTYSLIHDDLPPMDNDDMRRGKPTNHNVFGEAMAILAGDALLTYSFEVISNSRHLTDVDKAMLVLLLSKSAGPSGMVGGQVADMEGENRSLSIEELEYIHDHKTGELLSFSIEAGSLIAGAGKEDQAMLRAFARDLGLAFQIKDDILDIEGDNEKIGKPLGSDKENEKSTYPKLLGLAGAKDKLDWHINRAKAYLYKTEKDHFLLHELTDYIAKRTY